MKKHQFSWGMLLAGIGGVFGVVVAILYAIFKNNPVWMKQWFLSVSMGWGQFFSKLFSIVPFSMAEICWTIAILGLLFWGYTVIKLLVQRPSCWTKSLGFKLISLVCCGVFIWGGYTAFWAVGYRAPVFYTDAKGLSSQPISKEDLIHVTSLFAEGANKYASLVERNENDLFAVPLKPLFSKTDHLYDTLQQEFPALQAPTRRAKPMFYGNIMSRIGFTGFYFPFTGEANVNIDSPACLVPVTIAHELAHQRGVVFEDEANFTAIAACLSQPDPVFRYSAFLMGYIHLSNALLTADSTQWQKISGSLNELVVADLEDNNAFWEQYKSSVSSAAEGVYEGFLQSHGENRGMQSYGACVNLLVAYYKNTADLTQ